MSRIPVAAISRTLGLPSNFQQVVAFWFTDQRSVASQLNLDPRFLVGGQPRHGGGLVGQKPQHDQPDEHRRQPVNEEQPLPSAKAGKPVKAEQTR